MTNKIRYGVPLIAALLLSFPAACAILFSAAQLQVDLRVPFHLGSLPGKAEAALLNWHFNLLFGCGPLCSLFICSYAVIYRPRRHQTCRRNTKTLADNHIWISSFLLNLFLLATFFITQYSVAI